MTIELILELIGLGVSAAGQFVKGNPTQLEQSLLAIVQKGVSAYEQHTGKPIDPSLIRPIELLPPDTTA